MNESIAVLVTKRDIKRNTFVKDSGLNYVNVIATRTPNRQKKYEEEPNNKVGSKCEKKRHNLKDKQKYSRITGHIGDTEYCHKVLGDNLAIQHNSEVKVGQIRSIKRKKIRKIYLPEIVNNGVGSFDVSTVKKRRHRKVTSSKCIGTIFECSTGNSKSKEKTHLAVTKSMGIGPSLSPTLIIVHQKGSQRHYKGVKDTTPSATAGNIIVKSKEDILTHTESSSILTDIHDFLEANNIPTGEVKCKLINQVSQVPVECSKSSKRKIKSCLKSNEITKFKSSSSLRQKYEKLMIEDSVKKVTDEKNTHGKIKGDAIDNVSKQSNKETLNDKSITSTPGKPSLSDFDPNIAPQLNILSQDELYYDNEDASPLYNDGIKGMFKLWSRRFNLEEDYNKQNPTSSFDLSYTDKRLDSEQSQKKEKRFFIFKRKTKSKINSYKSKKPVITGICQVKEGVMIKVEPSKPTSFSYSSSKKALKIHRANTSDAQNWIQAFNSKENDNRRSVHIRWCNNKKTFSGSSSTVFELMNDVYNNPQTIFPSESELIQNGISYGPIKVPRSSFANRNYQAWMINGAIFNTPRPKHSRSNKSELLNKKHNVEIKNTNKRCFIEKSKAFSHRIEVVLHSKNINKSQHKDVSEEFIKIEIPKGFFNESSSEMNSKINGYSNEEVYNIIDYEMPSVDMDIQKNPDNEKLNYSTGDYKSNNQDTAKQKSEIFSRQPTNNEIFIPKKVDVVGVEIISKGDVDIVRRPMYNPTNETLRNDSQVLLKRLENKCKFSESCLQDNYKNWMPLSLDVYSWCVDESKIQSKNSQHCKQDFAEYDSSISKSCPSVCGDHNDSTEIITTSLNHLSSSEHTINTELQKMEEKKYPFSLFKKIKTWTGSKVNPELLKRAVPKDSLEVTKRRKVYARIKETANINKYCNGSKIDLMLSNKNCEEKKRVFVYDHARNTFVQPRILKFKMLEPNCDPSCPKSLENAHKSGSNCTLLNRQFQRVATRQMPYTGSKNNMLHGVSLSSNPHQPPSPLLRRSPYGSPTCPSPPQYHSSPMQSTKKDCDDVSLIYRKQYAGGSPDWGSPQGSSKCETPQYIDSNSQKYLNTAPVMKCDPPLEGGSSYVLNRCSAPRSPPYLNRRLMYDCHSSGTGANSHLTPNRSSPPYNITPYRIPSRMPPKRPSPHQLRQNPCPPSLLIKVSSTINRRSPSHWPKSGSREALRRVADQRLFINTSSIATEFKPGCGHLKCPVGSPIIDICSFKRSIKKLLGIYTDTKLSPKEVQCGDPLCAPSNLCKKNSQCEQLKLIIDAAGPLPLLEPPCGNPVGPIKRLAKKTKKVEVKCIIANTPYGVSQSPTKLQNKRSPLGELTVASVLSNAIKKGFEGSSFHSSNKKTIYSGDSKFPITSVISNKTIGSNEVDVNKSVSPDLSISPCGNPSSCRTTILFKVGDAPHYNNTCPNVSASNENNCLRSFGMTDSDISTLINKDPRFLITSIPCALETKQDPRYVTKKEVGTKCSNTKCNVSINQKVNKGNCCMKQITQPSFQSLRKPSPTNCKYNAENEISGIDYALPQNQNKDCSLSPICSPPRTRQTPQDRAGLKCKLSKKTCCDDLKFYPPPPPVPRNTVALDRPGPSFYIPKKQEKCDSPPKANAKILKKECEEACVSRFNKPQNMTNKGLVSGTTSNRAQKVLECDGPCVSRFNRPQNTSNKCLDSGIASNRAQKELECDGPCVSRFNRPQNTANKCLHSGTANNRAQKELECDGPCVSRFNKSQNMTNKGLVSRTTSNRAQKELKCDGPCVSRFNKPQNMTNKCLVPKTTSNRAQKEVECDGPCVSRFNKPQNMTNKGLFSKRANNRSRTNLSAKRPLNQDFNCGPKVLTKSTSYQDPCLERIPKMSCPKGANQGGSKLSWLAGKLLGSPICRRDQNNVSSLCDDVCCGDPRCLKTQMKSSTCDDVSCGDPRCLKTQIKTMSKIGGTMCSGTNTKSLHSMSKCVITEPQPEPCEPKNKKDAECMCTESPSQKKKKFNFLWPLCSKKSNQSTNQPKTSQSPPRNLPERCIAPLVDDDGRATIPSADFLRRNSICHSPKPCQQPISKPSCCDYRGGFKLHKPASKPLPTNHRIYHCASEIFLYDSSKQYNIPKMHSVQNITVNRKISSDKKDFKENSTTVNELYNANVDSCKCFFKSKSKIEKTEFSKISTNKSESDSNLTNTVEINFKLKLKKGDKAAEINFGHDVDKLENKCRGINKSSQEVYVLRENFEQSDLKSSRKNDLNIKIIIQNYNKSTPIDNENKPNKTKSDDVKKNEYSQNVSQKLCTVSTGYSDLLLQSKEIIPNNNIDSVVIVPTNLSVHRATINMTLSDKSDEIVKSSGPSLGATQTSLSLKTSRGVTKSSSDTSTFKNEYSAIFSVNKSNTTNYKEIKELNQTMSHISISSAAAHHTVTTVNKITEDESNKRKVEMSHGRSLSIQDKKDALKNLGEVIIDKEHNKENVQEFRAMLQAILASSASDSTTRKDNEKSSSKVTECNIIKLSSAERDGSKKYLSIEEGINMNATNYTEDTCCSGNKPNGCLCSLLAKKNNATRKYMDDSQPVCCCRKKQQSINKIDEDVTCDIQTRVELDFSEFNITTISKEVEANYESKDTSIHKASKDSDKTSCRNDNYLNDQEVEILNNILDSVTQKRENEIKNIAVKSSGNRRYANQINNKKQSLVDTSYGNGGTSMETMFFQELKRTKLRKNMRIINRNIGAKTDKAADVLQSYETKKAVLQIYAEKTKSESHFTAKLPKFMYKEDSLEDCRVQIREMTSSQKSYSNKQILKGMYRKMK